MNELIEGVRAAMSRHPCSGDYWIGYSGGLDSSVLLYLLARSGIPLRAVHVNHGLSLNADAWQSHCTDTAEALGVPITSVCVEVRSREGGLEQAARRARYQVFTELLRPGDQLLLAQHGDDQVETFFLRLLRGAGALGLAAMRECRPLGQGSLLRPLLAFSREQLEDYARKQGLRWIDDESNKDQRLERNYLRATVLPLLRDRWPLRERVMRAADNLRETAELLQEFGAADLHLCGRRGERFGESVGLDALRDLSTGRQKNLLRSWLAECGGDMPEAPHLQQALDQALGAADDSRMAVAVGGLVVRRFRNRLYLTPQQPAQPAATEWQWDGRDCVRLPDGWQLQAGPGWPPGDYRVRFRRGGERARPVGRRHSQTLKKLLQEWGLEPWLRDRVPLVYGGDKLLAVGDLFLCDSELVGSLKWRYGGACG